MNEWVQNAVASINNLQYQLKPCPFCGEKPRVSYSEYSKRFLIWCESSDCILHCMANDCDVEFEDMHDLITAWNTRKNEKGVVFV